MERQKGKPEKLRERRKGKLEDVVVRTSGVDFKLIRTCTRAVGCYRTPGRWTR